MKFLSQKLNIVVTAGASGIGRTIAMAYAREGSSVFVCDNSDEFILSFKTENPDIFIQKTDISIFSEVESFFNAVKRQVSSVDVLINCAGIAGPTANLQDVEPDEWDHTIAVNLSGMFYSLKSAIPLLKTSNQASIINIASSASFFGFPLRSPYTAAKWAVIGLTKTLAMELGGEGIRVNAICPGSVSGNRIEQVIQADALEQGKTVKEIKELYVKQVSMKTFVEPEDVANMALFLTSAYGRYISGQAIGLDGHTEGLTNSL
jgi:NAD(P)-dependent dehydrogenase (short-subunit alcohol dehydrogenase family)